MVDFFYSRTLFFSCNRRYCKHMICFHQKRPRDICWHFCDTPGRDLYTYKTASIVKISSISIRNKDVLGRGYAPWYDTALGNRGGQNRFGIFFFILCLFVSVWGRCQMDLQRGLKQQFLSKWILWGMQKLLKLANEKNKKLWFRTSPTHTVIHLIQWSEKLWSGTLPPHTVLCAWWVMPSLSS